MIDKDAPLVDVMSLLFVFAIAAFITSVDGSFETSGKPSSVIAITLTPIQINASDMSFNCSQHTNVRSSSKLSLTLFALSDKNLLTIDQAFDSCTEGVEKLNSDKFSNQLTMYVTKSLPIPEELIIVVDRLSDKSIIGAALDMEIKVEGYNVCSKKLLSTSIGKLGPTRIAISSGEC